MKPDHAEFDICAAKLSAHPGDGGSLDVSRYHTVSVLDAGSGDVRSIVTIPESDPYSGTSHRVWWSADGRAILIGGRGSLGGEMSAEPRHVCPVDADELIRPASCR